MEYVLFYCVATILVAVRAGRAWWASRARYKIGKMPYSLPAARIPVRQLRPGPLQLPSAHDVIP